MEIKVEELRIGSYVLRNGRPSKLDIGDFRYQEIFHHKPIPLTPEILESCGFVRVDDRFHHNWQICSEKEQSFSIQYGKKWGGTGYEDNPEEFLFSNDESDAGCYVIREVKYLHQLQNLYYCLSDEELQVKLPVTA